MTKLYRKPALGLLAALFGYVGLGPVQAADTVGATLGLIQQRGELFCGVSEGLSGFSSPDDKGRWTGIDVDFCRALAAATLGDAAKVRFTPLSAKVRFTALQSGEIDVLSRNTTFTFTRDVNQALDFPVTTYFDGQGFLVRKALNVTKPRDLDGATLCVNQGTTTEQNVADFFRTRGMTYELVTFEKSEEAVAAYEAGRCDVYTSDASGLYAQRIKLHVPGDHVILPDIISKEPLSPAVREGDDRWANVVRWTHYAMLTAEELGVTQANVETARKSDNPDIRRLLGIEGDLGAQLGLSADWGYQVVKQVGNYAEVFDRNVGAGSPLQIERGENALARDGGLQFAPPMR